MVGVKTWDWWPFQLWLGKWTWSYKKKLVSADENFSNKQLTSISFRSWSHGCDLDDVFKVEPVIIISPFWRGGSLKYRWLSSPLGEYTEQWTSVNDEGHQPHKLDRVQSLETRETFLARCRDMKLITTQASSIGALEYEDAMGAAIL